MLSIMVDGGFVLVGIFVAEVVAMHVYREPPDGALQVVAPVLGRAGRAQRRDVTKVGVSPRQPSFRVSKRAKAAAR